MKNMRNVHGFTLTEVLLAVMIVGLIGIALASLSRAASREAGVGRSRITLRNNMTLFLRDLRRDLKKATRVTYVKGDKSFSGTGNLLRIYQGMDSYGNPLKVYNTASVADYMPMKQITYCFTPGNIGAYPAEGSKDGGTIYRDEQICTTDHHCTDTCATTDANKRLTNVKYIPPGHGFTSPLFEGIGENNSLLKIQLITEVKGKQVINDVMKETFALSIGY